MSSKVRFVRNRRWIVGSALTASASLALIALYQTGILKRLPGPKSAVWNAETVNGSDEAYSLLQTPDAVLGLASYAITISLAAAGPADRVLTSRWVPIALGAKTLLDAAYAGKLSVEQWTVFRSFSIWSLIAAGGAMASLGFAMPETLAAVKLLRKG